MMRKPQRAAAILLCAALLLSTAACSNAPNRGAASPTVTAEPTLTAEATPTASPTAAPTPEPTAAPESEPESLSAELEAMLPLIQAHMLAQLNGMAFDASDPLYFWQTVCFAVDGCGLDFYSAETVGNALLLSRGVIEEIASGLFENGGDALPAIPEVLSGELQYDAEADAYAHPLGGGGYGIAVREVLDDGDGNPILTADLTAGGTTVAAFRVELTENTRAGNSLFTYSIRAITQM